MQIPVTMTIPKTIPIWEIGKKDAKWMEPMPESYNAELKDPWFDSRRIDIMKEMAFEQVFGDY